VSGAVLEEKGLPIDLTPFQAVEAAYPEELRRSLEALRRGLPVLVECEKELSPYFYRSLRDRLKKESLKCAYLDGRPDPNNPPPPGPCSLMGLIIAQLRDVVRGSVEKLVVVLPHLDLLTTTGGGLTAEAKEVIPLLYENPGLLWLGFKDPSFGLPQVIENLFPHRESILGVPRDRLQHLITQREARKFGRKPSIYQLYKYVSGLHAVRLRRLLASITGEDYPEDPRPAFEQLRSGTLGGKLHIPDLDLDRDIGGYARVKQRLKQEILAILAQKETLTDPEQVHHIEGLVPRGMIFWGPPGTGKTLFAKAMATALGAAVTVVSGPELKSRWVGESEERIRQVFVAARSAAPAVIIFDELDSFATARGTYTGSGVEHSMVNQLLTEMDGFRSNEMVFVVGTTNFVESLDPALLRPGRFEFHLQIPFPDAADRREILSIYDRKLTLKFDERALDYAVRRSGDLVEGSESRYTGDHLQALCRSLARRRLREQLTGATGVDDVERALTEYLERPELTSAEEEVVASHEAGHAVCALHCENAPPIERISIRGDLAGALGFVSYADPAHRYVTTRAAMLDGICMLFGGREAEAMMAKDPDDLSMGSESDLDRATQMARALCEQFGLGEGLSVRRYRLGPNERPEWTPPLSEETRRAVEKAMARILEEQRQRARRILEEHRAEHAALRALLLERKVLDRAALGEALAQPKKKAERSKADA
jgi:cell division protease FtsH